MLRVASYFVLLYTKDGGREGGGGGREGMAIERKSTYNLANHEGDEFEGSEPPWD